jgi:hypothetical protein
MDNNSVHLKLTLNEFKDLQAYCNLNNLDIDSIIKSSYLQGFRIEKYGLLGTQKEPETIEVIKEVEVEKIIYVDKPIIQEVIKEIPIEKIVIKEITKEVLVDKIVEVPKEIIKTEFVDKEVIKEVFIDRPVEKIVYVTDDSKMNELVDKINELENREPELVEVEKIVYLYNNDKISELENKVIELESRPPQVVEVIKEIIKKEPVEVVREVTVSDNKTEMLQQTLQKIRLENVEKDKKINELLNIIEEFKKYKGNVGAAFLKGSNLNETI